LKGTYASGLKESSVSETFCAQEALSINTNWPHRKASGRLRIATEMGKIFYAAVNP
jgi:hypothetical protein